MPVLLSTPYNPNPITKLCITFLLSFTVLHQLHLYFEWGIIVFLSFLFYKNGFKSDAVKNVLFFGVLSLLPNLRMIENMHVFLKMFFMLLLMCRIFYLPFLAGKLLIKTSDVGSIISSMDKIKLPRSISIPIAVMFRFFPSFKEEKRNIKLAMKIRGITFRNPAAYIEYVTVPLLVVSSNISDDISKAAETRCIENPVRKVRYVPVKAGIVDFITIFLVSAMVAGGLVW